MDDPERVIAEALRAQAAHTQVNAAPGLGLAGSGYGLISGNDVGLTLPTRAPESPTAASATSRIEPPSRTSVGAILLLAVVLGLAAGAVVGLVTLL